ncbi:MAG: DUF2203 family protein [Pseudomonadota bacterium]|nr:DUF2203 family protein [Pseudomonadota bacterium]
MKPYKMSGYKPRLNLYRMDPKVTTAPHAEQTEQFFTIDHANTLVPFLEETFLKIRLMQLMVQKNLNIIKHKGVGHLGIKDIKELNHLSAELDEEAVDAVSSLQVLLEEIQTRVKAVAKVGCQIDNLDQGRISWPSKHMDARIQLLWSLGDTVINRWRYPEDKEKHYPIHMLEAQLL